MLAQRHWCGRRGGRFRRFGQGRPGARNGVQLRRDLSIGASCRLRDRSRTIGQLAEGTAVLDGRAGDLCVDGGDLRVNRSMPDASSEAGGWTLGRVRCNASRYPS